MSKTPIFEHTVGSHSDDRGGDSDRRCTCQDEPHSHLDNDKDLRQEILYEFLNQFKEDKYLSQSNTDKAVEAIDQYTQSKLKAFAGEIEEAIGEYEYPEQHFPTVLQGENIEKYDKVTARDRLRAELRQALKAIKEKYQL